MIELRPVTLERHGIRLEPLDVDHHDALAAAAADGELWRLWFTSVPAPGRDAGPTSPTRSPASATVTCCRGWCATPPPARIIGTTRYHDIVRAHRSRRDRLHLVRQELAAHARQHHLQAAPARARVRDRRLQGGRPAHRQLQLRVAARDRGAGREEGRRASAITPRAATAPCATASSTASSPAEWRDVKRHLELRLLRHAGERHGLSAAACRPSPPSPRTCAASCEPSSSRRRSPTSTARSSTPGDRISEFLERWGSPPKEVVLVGMNPGPWGMAQTGIPFGCVSFAADWLALRNREVTRPAVEHPRRARPRLRLRAARR